MARFFTRKNSTLLVIVLSILFLGYSSEHPSSGSGGYTGAPGDSTCAATCHNGGSSISGNVQISGVPSTVLPGETYTFTVTLNATGGSPVKGGFQVVSLKNNNTNGGTFTVNGGETNSSVKLVAGKSYTGHKPAKNFGGNTSLSYTIDWTAPNEEGEEITFYVGSILANGASGNNGDKFVATNTSTLISSGNPPLEATFSNIIDASCSDSDDGGATVSASGGAGSYSYQWDSGESGATATMLNEGTHSVTITDASNDQLIATVDIGAPDPIIVNTISNQPANCNGENSGSAEILASGGTPGYSYNWGNGSFDPIQNNLAAGTYNITVTDQNNCTAIHIVTISEPAPLLINIETLNQPSCNGDSDGSITVSAQGGNGGYVFNWLTGAGDPNGGTLTNIGAGTYEVEVFDSEGCISNSLITLGEPELLEISTSSTDVSCTDGTDGTASVSINGGTPDYEIVWSTGETTSTVNNLTPGDYSVTVTDANFCFVTTSVTVNQPDSPVSVSIITDQNPSCGNSNGQLSALGMGGTPGYEYEWSNGSTSILINNIPAGMYAVTVTDMNGCTSSATTTLVEDSDITLAANNVVNNICFGDANGEATISAAGGDGSYTYEWSNGGTNPTETNLAAGIYTITVSDGTGCSSQIQIEITEPAELSAGEEITNLSCFESGDGSIILSPSGGTGNITINWGIGGNDLEKENLIAGSYNVTLTDESNCTKTFALVVSQPDELMANAIATSPSCMDSNDGEITIMPSGGTSPYTILWSTGDTTLSIQNLSAGDYAVTITDTMDCQLITEFTLDDPLPVDITASLQNPICFGDNNGSIVANLPNNGIDYTILWSTGDTTLTIENLNAGTYSLTITDDAGCPTITEFVLEDPSEIDPNFTIINESESGANDGSISADPLNGFAPYTYLWSTGDTTAMIDSLIPGEYAYTITDSIGCMIVGSAFVSSGDCNLEVDPQINNVLCFGNEDGSIDLSITNGSEPYTILWSDGGNGSDLAAGSYSTTVTDNNNCVYILDDLEVTEPTELTIDSVAIIVESAPSAMDGSISFNVNGGTGSYDTLLLDSLQNAIEPFNLNQLSAGTYYVVVIDENGCETIVGPLTVDVISSSLDVKLDIEVGVYPNPATDNVFIDIDNPINLTFNILDSSGRKLVSNQRINGKITQINTTTWQSGLYILLINQGEKYIYKKLIVE